MNSRKLLPLIFIACLFSCGKSEIATTNYFVAFSATLKGSSETPPNASSATGTASATYNQSTRKFSVYVTYSGLTATAAHIHKGVPGVPGAVVFPLTSLASPITFSTTLDSTQSANLMSGLYYVNIHSAAYPNGEIRGQLIVQ